MANHNTQQGKTQVKYAITKNNVILDLIQNFQHLSLLLRRNARGRWQIKFGMTSLCNNRGVTLIELLVVVLIIGILTAVAVPQYQKAVKKAQAVEAITNLKKLHQAQATYYLEHGTYTDNLALLDLMFFDNIYYYRCAKDRDDCYALRTDGDMPYFEHGSKTLWCRGTATTCQDFSNVQHTEFDTTYWIVSQDR